MRAAALLLLAPGALGHGAMYEPPSRNSRGIWMMPGNGMGPSCPGGACFWMSEGCSIGCPVAKGDCENGTAPDKYATGSANCAKEDGLAEPTIGTSDTDRHLRTYNVDGKESCLGCPPGVAFGDWTKYNPWRKPGSAPVADPCGIASGSHAGGGTSLACTGNGGVVPVGARKGDRGSELPPLLERTVWVAGSAAEVAWAVAANHGGGYSYRLCPAGSPITEECFQRLPLRFVGNTSWVQYGLGMDAANRTEIPANQVSVGTVPEGSQWRRNPIPGCSGFLGGANGLQIPCKGTQFPPPIPGLSGFGSAACGANPGRNRSVCLGRADLPVGIVDKVDVSHDIPPGEYVLGFRWDTEETEQVWQQCADVTVKAAGRASTPFTPLSGCDPCCGGGICANCSVCGGDRTGACARCYTPFDPVDTRWPPTKVACLGYDSTPGWRAGNELPDTWSPGCERCWAEEGACTPRDRE